MPPCVVAIRIRIRPHLAILPRPTEAIPVR